MSETSAQAGFSGLPRRQVVLTMAGVMLGMFLAALDQTVVGTAMPRIVAELGGFDRYAWVTTAYLVASTTMVPVIGRLSDMYGRKWFYVGGIAIFLLGSFLCGLSQTMTQLIAFRAFQGLGAGMMMANSFVVIGDLFPPAERGKWQGLISGVFALASVIGPALGGFLTDVLSWHWVFFVNIPLGLLLVALFVRFFPHVRPAERKHQLDYVGATLLVLAVVPILLALSWGGVQYPWGSAQIVGSLGFGVAMTGVFLFVESRVAEPIVPLGFFRSRAVAIPMAVIFLTGFGMFGGLVFIPLFFQGVLGASAMSSGSFLTPMMLGITAGSLASGQALSRLGGHYREQGLVGLGITSLGMLLLARMTTSTTFSQAVLNVVIVGIGLGVSFPVYVIAIQNAVPHRVMGVATSTTQFVRSIGGTLGLAISGSLMASRFASELTGHVPAAVKAALSPEQLSAMASNPQALFGGQAPGGLLDGFGRFGEQGAELSRQLVQALREALVVAERDAFILVLAVMALAFVATLFLPELPLQGRAKPGRGQGAEQGPAPGDAGG